MVPSPSLQKRLRGQSTSRLLRAHGNGSTWDYTGSLEFGSELRYLAQDLLGMQDPSGLWLSALRLEIAEELLRRDEELLGRAHELLSYSEEFSSKEDALALLAPFAGGWRR